MTNHLDTYDYIVVGAGSAGCALAYRLSTEASRKVLLLEAGGQDTSPLIHMPLGFAFLMKNPRVNWCYETEPEPHMKNRKIAWPRGKVIGGCSSINGMLYVRGQKEDYDEWANQGCDGWSYEDVLPYFKRAEHKAEGRSHYHGFGGPLWVEEVKPKDTLALADLFVQSCVETGIPHNEDFNGENQEGAGSYQLNIRKGRRQNTGQTYLQLCKQRPNLTVITQALTRRILIDDGVAIGVEFSTKNKGSQLIQRVYSRQEVILCSGVVNSPQLLELSGVGDSQHLESLAIPVKKHLPGVGENLQDHLTINIQQGVKGVKTFYDETRPLALVKNVVKYLSLGKGLLTHPASQVGAFFKLSPESSSADAQIHFAPAASETDHKGNLITKPGTTATVCYLRPRSRGSVHIRCSDPSLAPRICANYLGFEEDRRAMIGAVRKVREIFFAPTMDQYRGKEIQPGSDVQTDDELLDFIRSEGESVYHPIGTCKMGNDPLAVVDERLKVHGIQGLRVADASIMPTIISGNTHAAAVMIAEKCADMILQEKHEIRL